MVVVRVDRLRKFGGTELAFKESQFTCKGNGKVVGEKLQCGDGQTLAEKGERTDGRLKTEMKEIEAAPTGEKMKAKLFLIS